MRMRYYTGETWVEGENEQAEVIDSLIAEVTEIGRQEGLKEAREEAGRKAIEEGRREEREIMLEKLKAVLAKSGLDEKMQVSLYEEFIACLAEVENAERTPR